MGETSTKYTIGVNVVASIMNYNTQMSQLRLELDYWQEEYRIYCQLLEHYRYLAETKPSHDNYTKTDEYEKLVNQIESKVDEIQQHIDATRSINNDHISDGMFVLNV